MRSMWNRINNSTVNRRDKKHSGGILEKMEREITYKKIRSIKELREFIKECLIEHAEARTHAFMTRNLHAVFYEQGWMDALKTVKEVISKDGLMLYRYKFNIEEQTEKEREKHYQ